VSLLQGRGPARKSPPLRRDDDPTTIAACSTANWSQVNGRLLKPISRRCSAVHGPTCSSIRTRTRKWADRDNGGPSRHAGRQRLRRSTPVPSRALRFRTRRELEKPRTACKSTCRCWASRSGSRSKRLWIVGRQGRREEVFEGAGPGALIEVSLPREHPNLPAGAPVYLLVVAGGEESLKPPRTARSRVLHRTRRRVDVELLLSGDGLTANRASGVRARSGSRLPGPFPRRPRRCLPFCGDVARAAFERLGGTGFEMGSFTLRNER